MSLFRMHRRTFILKDNRKPLRPAAPPQHLRISSTEDRAENHGRRPCHHLHRHLPADPAQRGARVLQGGRDPVRPEPNHQAAHRLQIQDRGGGEAWKRRGHVRRNLSSSPHPTGTYECFPNRAEPVLCRHRVGGEEAQSGSGFRLH